MTEVEDPIKDTDRLQEQEVNTQEVVGEIDDEVEVEFKGGVATVKWNDKGSIFLSGPAETVFHGQIDLSFL